MIKLLLLATLFEVKHLIGDVLLQRHGQSGRKRLDGLAGVMGVFDHSLNHYILSNLVMYITMALVGGFAMILLWIPVIDFGTHFAIDFTKVRIEKCLRLKWLWPDFEVGKVPYKRTLLVLDQLLHHGVYCWFLWKIYTGVM